MFAKSDKKGEVERPSGLNQIDHGTKITGDIESQGNFRIDGEVVGNIISKAKVFLGKSAKVTGNITAVNAEIEGSVIGNLEISELLTLKETSKIQGDVAYGKTSVTPGAEIDSSSFVIISKKTTVVKEIRKPIAKPVVGKTA